MDRYMITGKRITREAENYHLTFKYKVKGSHLRKTTMIVGCGATATTCCR